MRKTAFFLLLIGMALSGYAKVTYEGIPPVPDPPRLVNDFAGVLTDAQVADFERRLVEFSAKSFELAMSS